MQDSCSGNQQPSLTELFDNISRVPSTKGVKRLRSLLLLVILVLLSACSTEDLEGREAYEVERLERKLDVVTPEFFNQTKVKPISLPSTVFNRITGWYDENQIFYLTSNNGLTSLYQYHLTSGYATLFYESPGLIADVKGNIDRSMFAIHETKSSYENSLSIVDEDGHQLYRWQGITYNLQYFWNPYDKDKLLIVSMLPNWEFQVYLLDVHEKKLEEIEINNPYLHWYSQHQIAYLNWNELESHIAPIYVYDIKHKTKAELIGKEFIAFYSYPHYLFAVSEDMEKGQADFSFYQTSPLKEINSFSMPVINTFSEQWWVPEHELVYDQNLFYYLKPNFSNQTSDKIKDYSLIKYDINTGIKSKVISLNMYSTIKCSPDGDWCLVGKLLEKIVDMKQKKAMNLIEVR